jgi:hypothetical protein
VDIEYIHADVTADFLRIGIAETIQGHPESDADLIAPYRRRVEDISGNNVIDYD